MTRNYAFYTKAQKRWLIRFAEKLEFEPGKRLPDGVWDDIEERFESKFDRWVDGGRLAFQARTLCKTKSGETRKKS